MKIALATQGTRGDFQPVLALAEGLVRANHEVLIFGNEDHCKASREFGYEAVVVCPEIKDILNTELGKKAMETGDLLVAFKAMEDTEDVDWQTPFKDALQRFKPDALVYTPLIAGLVNIYSAFVDPNLPCFPASLQPQTIPSDETGPVSMYRVELEEGQPMMSKWLLQLQYNCRSVQEQKEHAKKEGKLSAEIIASMETPEDVYNYMFCQDDHPIPQIMAYSPAFWPAPPDWPKKGVVVTGRWSITKDQQESKAQSTGGSFFSVGSERTVCEDFIKAGPPPVYVGWGSMTVKTNEHMAWLAVESLRLAGQRGIIVAGWASMSDESLASAPNADELRAYCKENVLFMKAAPHEWLFPQCAACVHHGGIGTAQASLGAGVPTVVTPVFADQHEIAHHLDSQKLGVGTTRLPKLEPEELAAAIRRCCTDKSIKENCARRAEDMAKEDGVKFMVSFLESYIHDEIQTGAWQRRKQEHADKMAEKRKKGEKRTLDQKLSVWTHEINGRWPTLKAWNEKQMAVFANLMMTCKKGKLWYITGTKVLARSGEKLKSDEVGRFGQFAFLELIEQKGSRLHVKRLKGVGPAEGWVSTEVKGVEIVAKVAAAEDISKIMTDEYKKQFNDIL